MLEIVVPPTHGTATVSGGRVYAGLIYADGVSSQQILYTPDEGFADSDSLMLRVTDAAGLSTIGERHPQARRCRSLCLTPWAISTE
jgi:hypothetical protein